MLNFLEQGHKFDLLQKVSQRLDFGNAKLFTSLVPDLPIQQLEQSLASGAPLFGSSLLIPAVSFHAECVVLMEKATSPQFPEIQLRNNFDFGFVQGLKSSDFHIEFWGQHPQHGRTATHIEMPNVFEVDTHPSAQPFTRVPESRFEIRNITQADSRFNSLRISADFTDHPLHTIDHNVSHKKFGVKNFVRFVSFEDEFRTIFCVRRKADGEFAPISAAGWTLRFKHFVDYSGNGSKRNFADRSGGPLFVARGSPSQVNEVDKSILKIAKSGGPFITPAILGPPQK